jgi:hypothetical protein
MIYCNQYRIQNIYLYHYIIIMNVKYYVDNHNNSTYDLH